MLGLIRLMSKPNMLLQLMFLLQTSKGQRVYGNDWHSKAFDDTQVFALQILNDIAEMVTDGIIL